MNKNVYSLIQSKEEIDKVYTGISTFTYNWKLKILLIEKHIYIFCILMFVYVVLKAKFLKVECLVFHKFFIFVGASDFINDWWPSTYIVFLLALSQLINVRKYLYLRSSYSICSCSVVLNIIQKINFVLFDKLKFGQ